MNTLEYFVFIFAVLHFPDGSDLKPVAISLTRKTPLQTLSSISKVKNTLESSLVKTDRKGGSTFLTNVDLSYYTATISVGTPPTVFNALIDTGSPMLWILSSDICVNNEAYCKNHNVFDNTTSTTYQSLGEDFTIKYGKGRTEGILGRESVTIGGLEIKNQLFGEATKLADSVEELEADGILGLSVPRKSKSYYKEPLFITMFKQGIIDKPVFGVYLSKEETTSEIVFGGVNKKHYCGSFTYSPVIGDTDWSVNIDKLIFKGETLAKDYPVVIDSGSTIIAGPPEIIDPISKSIGEPIGKGNIYIVDCNKTDLPSVTVVISGKPITLVKEDYLIPVKDGEGRVVCIVGFSSVKGLPLILLGDTFMRKVYIQFDYGKKRIGFAPAKP